MKDLFLSECRRFRNAALIFAAVHMVLLIVVNRMTELLQQRWQISMLALVAYTTAGLAFALVQFGSYRQPGRWLWLLHRPMARGAVFGAVALASSALIVLAVGVPALLTVAGMDGLSARTVDARHYALVLEVVLLTIIAWLVGSYVIINGRRSAIVVLLLPVLLLLHLASVYVLLLPTALCLVLMAFIVYGTFKPDRAAPPSGLALVATAVPLQIGFYFAMIWSASLVYQNALILAGVHPLNREVPPAGGYTESTRAESRDLMLMGLASATDPRAAQWRRQVPLLEMANFQATGNSYPVRHQASNLDILKFTDTARHIEWTFSHDAMRFHGRDTHTSQDRGWLGAAGIGDSGRFAAVPVLPEPFFMMPHGLDLWSSDTGKVHPMIRLAPPETLARQPKEVGTLWYVVTNARVIAYAKPAAGDTAMLREQFSVALPDAFSQLDRIDTATLLDGTLVSLTFGHGMVRGGGEAHQTIVLVDPSGSSTVVAQRRLEHDFPQLFEHHDWWISPVLHTVLALPDALYDKGLILDQGHTRYTNKLELARPALVWQAALAAALLSALLAWWWLRRVPLTPTRRAGWIASCLLLGPPALACMLVLQTRQRRASGITRHNTALAAA
jgi:hypothetical protein